MMAILKDELMDLNDELAMLTKMAEAEALEPSSLAEVKHCLDWPDWKQALAEELVMLHEASTWKIIKPPPGANIVGSKWVSKLRC